MYNEINSLLINLRAQNPKLFWLIIDLILFIIMHLVWFIFSYIYEKRDIDFEAIRKPLYYKYLSFVLFICLGFLIGA